jgi:hypothetical protein
LRLYLKKKNLYKNRAGGVAQGGGPEFKPQYSQKKEKKLLSTKETVILCYC